MAQTIRIEIPVEVQDNTGAVEGIKKKLEDLGKTSESVSKSLNSIGKTGTRKGLMSFADIDSSSVSKVLSGVESGGSKIGRLWSTTTGVVNKLMSPLTSVTSMLTSPLTGLASMAGASMGVADAVSTYSDFGATMSRVEALANANEEQMAKLTQTAKDMGASTKFSATESAEAFTYMAQAGWGVDDMINGIGGVMSLAAADGLDLASTTDIVSNALTAFGLSAKDTAQFADVLAVASSASNTDVYNLGESLKYAAPVMGALGYNIQDTALALGLMSNNAITGGMAGTALRTSLANMASPTDAMATAMEKYGISLTDSEGNMKSLRGVMENLRSSLGGLSESEQTAAASTIFGKEAMSGMLAIINASEEDWQSLAAQIDNSAGAADRMAETMQDNLAGALEEMGGAVETAQITLGERLEPYITGVAGFVTDAMPAVEDAINGMMDFVDAKVGNMSQKINALTLTDEWQNADLFGKINLAWDKLIMEPSASWLKETGVHIATGIVGGMFSEAAKILPGGEEAGIMSWLSAGTLIKGADKTVSGIRKFTSALGEISPIAGKAGIAAAAVAAGITAVAVAVDNYNQKTIDDSLEKHFGKIALSAEQVEDVAAHILEQDYLVNVNASLGEIQNAEEFHSEAEEALASNDALEFKGRIGIELTADEQQEYQDNVTTFIDNKIKELESETYSAHIQVETYLGGTEEGQTLSQNIEQWARADNLELTNLSNDLQSAVESALADGIISVDEEAAISALQDKMNSITSRWKQAEAEAEWDWISQEYGRLSGADLESGAFEDVVASLQSQRESAGAAIEADAKDFYSKLNAMEAAGRISASENDRYKELAGWAIRGQQGQELGRSLEFEANTLQDAYGDKLSSNISQSQADVSEWIGGGGLDTLLQQGDVWQAADLLRNGGDLMNAGTGKGAFGVVTDADQAALSGLYETMKPDVTAMEGLIDQYRDAGQAIPQALMDSYNSAVEVGAASGDQEAAWAAYANQLLETGSDELVSALTDQSNPMYEGIRSALPEEMRTAIDRAAAETTTDPVTLDGLNASIEGDVEVDKQDWLSKIQSNLEEGDIGTITAATDAEIEVTVNKGDCLSQIGEAVGVDWQEIAAYNGIEDPYTIYPGMEIKIPTSAIDVDASGVGTAVEQATETDPVNTEAQANITVVPGETDTSQVEAAVADQDDGDAGTVPMTATADTTVVAGNVDVSEAYANAASETQGAFDETIPADGNVDVDLSQTNNASAIYGEVDSQVKSTFATGFSASANVAVTLNWSLVNPTANISVGGAGTGSASVSASLHAEGGIMAAPHLGIVAEDGPEAIIPLSGKRRNRGLELWQQAGLMLGIPMHADGGIFAPYSLSNTFGETDSGGNAPGFNVSVPESKEAGDSGKPFQVSVNMNNTFEISGDNPTNILQMIKANMKTITDDLSKEIADRLADSFSNRPV